MTDIPAQLWMRHQDQLAMSAIEKSPASHAEMALSATRSAAHDRDPLLNGAPDSDDVRNMRAIATHCWTTRLAY